MKNIKKIIMATFIAATLLSAGHNKALAIPVVCTNCSDLITQIMEFITSEAELGTVIDDYAESITQTANQMEQIKNQLDMYENMLKNTAKLPADVAGKIQSSFGQLAKLSNQLKTKRGDVSALGNIFNQVYPELDFLNDLAQASPDNIAAANSEFHKQWMNWSKQVDEAQQATFQLSGAQLQELSDSALEEHLEELLKTPEGQMQAIESGNQLAAVQIQESRQLRTILATSVQGQAAATMKSEKDNQASKELQKKLTDMKAFEGVTGKNAKELR